MFYDNIYGGIDINDVDDLTKPCKRIGVWNSTYTTDFSTNYKILLDIFEGVPEDYENKIIKFIKKNFKKFICFKNK